MNFVVSNWLYQPTEEFQWDLLEVIFATNNI